MFFKSAITTEADPTAAVSHLKKSLDGVQPDLLLIFVSHHYGPDYDELLSALRDAINTRNLIGCTGESIIGPDREIERAPAIAVWAAKLPDVRVLPFVVDQNDVQSLDGAESWREHLGVQPHEKPGFIVLPDPFSIDAESCLEQMDDAFPGSKIVGGLASGANAPGQNRLFLGDQVLRQGLVGVSLSGPIAIHAVVSQGCRPIGEPFVVTKADQNVIFELRGKPVLEVLRQVYNAAPPADQQLMQQGLHVGRVVDERLGKFGPGDFLIRNLMGVVNDEAVAINALVRPGQTIQFHVRDSKTADEEMKNLLTGKVTTMPRPPMGGLLFSCNGRGSRLFGAANHDIGLVNKIAGNCEVAGFFAAGEIGPVGDKTFIHGFTSSLILFHEAR